ncbi:MAG: hypothetical protein IJC71_05155 [Clostridia bacterium]|nr:hypothetical protein [Clostridia bacterium]
MSRNYILEDRDYLAELIRRNFAAGDIVVHLTYPSAGTPAVSYADAEKDITDYIRAAKSLWQQNAGQEEATLRYIGITGSERNGSREGMYQHFFILPGSLNPAAVCDAWKKGKAKVTPLFDSKGKVYIVNRVTNKRQTSGTWYFSRHLEQTYDTHDLSEELEGLIYYPCIDDDEVFGGIIDEDNFDF